MQLVCDFNVLALVFLGFTREILFVTSKSVANDQLAPLFACNFDVERPFAFCRRAKSLTDEHTADVYSLARANPHRLGGEISFFFDCQGLTFSGKYPADNTVCCEANFGLKVADWNRKVDMKAEIFDQYCAVVSA